MSITVTRIDIRPLHFTFKRGLGCEERIRAGLTWADRALGPLDNPDRDHCISGFIKLFSISFACHLSLWGDGKPTTYSSI